MQAFRRNRLVAAVQLSLLATVPGLAFAQDAAPEQKATTLQGVTVTGSRIKRVETETASPVFQIDRQAIENSGAQTIGQFIQETPAISGAATNPTVNNGGGAGESTISLRGLNEVRTLILVNGRRIVTRDVNAIPMNAVERVEVLKDGASAIYGSDAVGGVVNFILKRNFEGVSAGVNYGQSGHGGDGKRRGANAMIGLGGDRGNVIIGANYNKQDEISAAARDFSKNALTLYGGVVNIGGSSRTTTGRYSVPDAAAGRDCDSQKPNSNLTHIAGTPGTRPQDFRCFTGDDLFNYQAVGNVIMTPQERAGLFVIGNFDLTDDITAYVDSFSNKTRSAGQIAPLPYDGRPGNDNVVISAQNIYNPFGVDITDSRLRLTALGNRRYNFNTEVNEVNGGLKGKFGDTSWAWDASASFGKIRQDQTTSGYIQSSRLAAGLGPSFVDAQGAHCGTPGAIIANCTPLNFFGVPYDLSTPAGQAAQAALNAIAVSSATHLNQLYRGLQVNFDGDLFELPAGTVQSAFGAEYRKTSLAFTPDAFTRYQGVDFTCEISSEACASQTAGFVETKELYGELLIPLLADKPFAKSLTATLGSRYSRYNSFGNTTNSKLGIEWRPVDNLLVRGTYAEVFRAPTINDLYGGQYAFSAGFTDPCNGYTGPLNGNPACQNVAPNTDFKQSDTQLSAILGGTSTLKPEQGSVFTLGFVYDPSWLENFSMTVDAWRVHLDDTIGNYGTFTVLQNCFQSTNAAPSPFCARFSRDPDGEIIRLFDPQANIGETDTKGIDFGFSYKMDTDWGKFRARLDSTYTAQYDVGLIFNGQRVGEQHNAGTFLSSANGGLGNYSRWRGLGSLNWELGNWSAQWTARYIHGFQVGSETRSEVPCADILLTPGSVGCELNFGATTYHNLQLGYKIAPLKAQLRVGVDNAFDKQPPIIYQNNTLNANTDERTFDLVGRYYWTSLQFTF